MPPLEITPPHRPGAATTGARVARLAACGLLALAAVGGAPGVAAASRAPGRSSAPASKRLPPDRNPARSIAPSRAFDDSCFGDGTAKACNAAALADIDAARASEGYGKLEFPSNFSSMSGARQLLTVTNDERTSRGLPAFGASAALDSMAEAGARASSDPQGPSGFTWGANAAWGYETALAADYGWMYDDGPGSPNVTCPYAGAAGCWGHRHNILVGWEGKGGGAAVDLDGLWVMTELFVKGY